ncbi:MAG: CapA family protein [Oscillospiraceae bacterium]|nr:CapA family protein [Oscillospiraceae bacterium]
MKFIATGDTIVTCPYTKNYEGYRELVDFIRSADVRMNNMECPLSTGPSRVSAFSGRPWMRGEPTLLDDIAEFGFNCYSFANNHSLDYFYDGLLSTLSAFEERGLPYAGAGRSLTEATRHCRTVTPNGTLAMVAVFSTYDTIALSAQAGDAKGSILPRPGVNMLRHRIRFSVTREQMDRLREIADAAKINSRLKNRLKLGSVKINEDTFPFGDMEFSVGEPGRTSEPNPYDMERLEAAVRAAVADADRTVVYLHSHESKGESDAEPDFYAETFARACIDWGADAVVGSGTHQAKGVEFYKGKPIFYCMGNFFFRPFDMPEYPNEWYDLYKMEKTLTPREAEQRRTKNGTIGLVTQRYCYRGLAPMIEWDDDGNLKTCAALAVGLGFDDAAETRGFPRVANEEDTQALFEQMKLLCEPYGTRVTLKDGLMHFSAE